MFLGKIIKKPDVAEFEKTLKPHQCTVSADGFTVLGKALIEHNIEVISKIYQNISFDELGGFLEISATHAEQIIASMVSENRIRATLDQRSRIVEFLQLASGESSIAMFTYNSQINNVCTNLSQVLSEILKMHPDLQKYDTHMI